MGTTPSDNKKATAAAAATKERFKEVWRSIRGSAEENWSIDLRSVANLVGFCRFPVGWAWCEYPRKGFSERLPYEAKAQQISHVGIQLEEADSEDGQAAFDRGMSFRKQKVGAFLVRMIRRQEIDVIVYDEVAQGHPLGDKVRLHPRLKIDVRSNCIGLNELGPGDAWAFSADAESVHRALEGKRAWNTKSSANDWLMIERYLRELFETRGLPDSRDQYANEAAIWYAASAEFRREPAKTELRAMASRLYEEYSFSEI